MKIKSITLKYHREDGDWHEQELASGTYVIGRSAQADLQFDSSNISRQHCQIEVTEDHVTIMDMGSSNGTYVDGEKLAPNVPVTLKPEQTFKVGSFEACMVWMAAVDEAPLYDEASTSRRSPEPLKGKIQEEEEAVVEQYTLHLTNSQGESREVVLEPGQYVMGRTASADIQIEETKASRLHARIYVTQDGCQIEDVGSSNGTKLNGETLTPHELIDFSLGQVVEIGGCSLSLQRSGAGMEALGMEDDATQIEEPENAAETMVEPVGVENETLIEEGIIEDSTQIDSFEDDSTQLDGLGADSTQLDASIEGERTSIGEVPMQVDRTFLDGLTPVQQIEDASNGLILRFQRDQGAWDQITLRPGEYVLGRSEEADLSIPDTKISRRHAKIIVDAAMGCFLMDMGSANGTQINGNPLRPRVKVPFGMSQTASMGSYLFQVMPLAGESRTMIEVAQSDIGETLVSATQMAPIAALTLRYREGNGPWQELPLGTGEQIMGRSSEAQLRIPSNTISRRHASLFIQEGRVWITDLSSKNGILINGQRIPPEQSVELSMGQKFMVDDFVFEINGGGMQIAGYDPTLISGDVAGVILEPGRMDALLNIPSSAGAGEHTMIGEEMGIDMALLGGQQAQAPINLAGHERVTIGRGADNMISFEHPLVSRYHAVIERMGTRTRIIDLHSANGVYINGQKVENQSWLKQGDSIKIGPYLIGFTGNELRPSAEQSYNIDVVGLQKWVTKDINLLKEISLNVGRNEFVALVGMSGAGKSTLMDAINGFRPATHGAVYVNGTDLYDNYGQFRDEIGNVPQRDIVHMELTAEQALEYAAQLRMPADTTAAERQQAVNGTLEDLGLTFRKDVQISRLSGGQIKRVSIGVELLTKPRLFFLDEPTSGLDPGTEYEMMKLLRRLADQGRTIMIITHATKNVMFCDKAIILANRGNLAFYGPPENALAYFDQYRTHRERLEKDMEFDDIYRILEDPDRGKPEDWRERYLQSEYAKYALPKQSVAAPQAQPAAAGKRKQGGKRISAFKQFFVLSHRYLRCMFQDKASLILTLSLAPMLGLMNFIWGNQLFDPVNGTAAKTMGVWFSVTITSILVGYMGSIQELVKEKEIYKRERAVGLKILPYIMSKVWVGAILALYQAFTILLFTLLLVRPDVVDILGYVSMYITLLLVIFCSFIMGLLISAVSQNPNMAQLIMIGTFVPQMLLAGVLQPLHMIVGGETISTILVARWGFENLVHATGMGDPMVEDACWSELDRDIRNNLTNEQKETLCECMGPQLFENCRTIPGILSPDFYGQDAQLVLAMDRPQSPPEPGRLPTPTQRNTPTLVASPTFYPSPTYMPTPTPWMTPTSKPIRIHVDPESCGDESEGWTQEKEDCANNQLYNEIAWQKYEAAQQMEDYQVTREAQFDVYRDDTEQQFMDYRDDVEGQFEEYKEDVGDQLEQYSGEEREIIELYAEDNMDVFEVYKEDMEEYSDELTDYERTRQKAISSAEAVLGMLWDDYGRTFQGTATVRMLYIGIITVVEFILLLIMMKRKDTV